MTVVLTGDVHQWIDSADRAYARETETALALRYARIAGHHGLKVTLFVTGRAVVEGAAAVRQLLTEENVEIGGHGWDSFLPSWRYRLTNKLFGSPHGSSRMQAWMVRRTCATIERATERNVQSWRNHGYRFDRHTSRALAEAGVRVWSDEVDRSRVEPYRHESGIAILPINTTPDHEHLLHGGQTERTIPAGRLWEYYDSDAWRQRVLQETKAIVTQGGVATILAHPLCMKVVDDWQTFERLCSSLSAYPSAWAPEAAGLLRPGEAA